MTNSIDPFVIKNDLVILEPVSHLRIDDFHEYSTKKELYTYLTYDVFKKKSETINYLNKLIKRSDSKYTQYWFIILKENKKTIGTIGLINFSKENNSVEIGYGLSPDYWNKGIFNSSAKLLLNSVFLKYGINNFTAKTSLQNTNSIKALEKIGFLKERVLKNFYVYFDGHTEDAQILKLQLLNTI